VRQWLIIIYLNANQFSEFYSKKLQIYDTQTLYVMLLRILASS